MNFTGPIFLTLLAALFALHWSLPDRFRSGLLLAGSYLFYAWWDLRFVPVLLGSTALDFTTALLIEKHTGRKRRVLLYLSVVANLLILASFKYANFLLAGLNIACKMVSPSHPALSPFTLFVPLGVSFYTFHSISYVVDVYRGRIAAIRSPVLYALYVTFFPKLIAGPIERTENFVPQLRKNRRLSLDDILTASALLAMGYFLKLCIGDRLAPTNDFVFRMPLQVPLITRWAAFYGFSFQIYADFFGYTLIARGAARLFGLRLSENFYSPYFAASPREFWRRWHVSLSTWFRDYVYIPLGGDRSHLALTLLLTMALAGLWHGASFHFLAWGFYHGVLLVMQRAFRWPAVPRVVGIFFTFHLVTFGWVLFKAETIGQALLFARGLLTAQINPPNAPMPALPLDGEAQLLALLLAAWLFAIGLTQVHAYLTRPRLPYGTPWRAALTGFPLGILLAMVVIAGASHAKPFLYFYF